MHRPLIAVVDYGMGNVGSVANMLRRLGNNVTITQDHGELRSATKLILPGVGAFGRGIEMLSESGLANTLTELVIQRMTPILGICLGMQLMTRSSEEGDSAAPGLGWIDAKTVRLKPASELGLKVPHMGWSHARPVNSSPLFVGVEEGQRFYFVHSYQVVCNNLEDVAAVTFYGGSFVAAFSHGHIHGVQFHPEKSHRFGMALLKRFVESC